jgi:hypothetical protein
MLHPPREIACNFGEQTNNCEHFANRESLEFTTAHVATSAHLAVLPAEGEHGQINVLIRNDSNHIAAK